jgi:hypothetical protein
MICEEVGSGGGLTGAGPVGPLLLLQFRTIPLIATATIAYTIRDFIMVPLLLIIDIW